jgi:membrane-associated protein
MENLQAFWNLLMHFDSYLDVVIPNYGGWTYFIISFIIFAEVGLVVTGILPGDSLLFAAGAIAARGTLHLGSLLFLLIPAAALGNISNYMIGSFLGPWLEKRKHIPFFSHADLARGHHFFEENGRWAVIIARFLPIFRTFAPLAAGISKMDKLPFFLYSLAGCAAWVSGYVLAGYFFGNIPFIKEHFMLVVLGIVFVTMLPTLCKTISRLLHK